MAKKRRTVQRCEPLNRYIELHGIDVGEVAERLKKPAPTVRSWVNGWRPITAETAVHIEQCLGIPRETLRPDLFVKRAA